ncbi:MAG: hypothetical protein NT124_05345 [Candidatus Dependentiae bacterium]|nr:hypothetical protein [Candidatus Dependentiae bacterium]
MKKIYMLSVGFVLASFIGVCHATTNMINGLAYPIRVGFGRVGGAICPSVNNIRVNEFKTEIYGDNSCIMDRLTVQYLKNPGVPKAEEEWVMISEQRGRWSHPQWVFVYQQINQETGAIEPTVFVK